jgi:N-acetylmuramoyl-L-alanine amidase
MRSRHSGRPVAARDAERSSASDLVVREGQGWSLSCRSAAAGRFVVLKSPDLPSVLEAGYISNPDDARRLIDPPGASVCGRVAQAIEIFLARQEAAGIAP